VANDFVGNAAVADKANADFFVLYNRFVPAFDDVSDKLFCRIVGYSIL
jgi:hypothetical protein